MELNKKGKLMKLFLITKIIIELLPIDKKTFNIGNYSISGNVVKKLLILINELSKLIFMLLQC